MKRKLKILILLGVMIVNAATLTACVQQQANDLASALEKKYNMEFTVEKIGGSYMGSSGVGYSAYCAPADNADLLFKVDVLSNGEIFDDYEKMLIGNAVEEKINEAIPTASNDYRVIVNPKNNTGGFKEGTDVVEFIKEHGIKMNVTLIMNADKSNIEPDYLFDAFCGIGKLLGNYSGSLNLHFADSDQMETLDKFLKESPYVTTISYYEYGEGFNAVIENGVINKTKDDFINALY